MNTATVPTHVQLHAHVHELIWSIYLALPLRIKIVIVRIRISMSTRHEEVIA